MTEIVDCHMHIYDHRYPWAKDAWFTPDEATVEDYRSIQQHLGSTHNVIVQPSSYGTDNSLLLHSLSQFDDRARGVVAIASDTDTERLKDLDAIGVRGVRVNLGVPGSGSNPESIVPIARKIADLAWHLELHGTPDLVLPLEGTLETLPCPVVFDHLGRVPQPAGAKSPMFRMVNHMLSSGQAWVKVSGFYHDSKAGAPLYDDLSSTIAAFARENPDHLVWASDWPHVSESIRPKTTDMILALENALPDKELRTKILGENALRLYRWQ